MLKTPVGRLRLLSILDALSWLYLIYCAIYLKRILGDDTAVNVPGKTHAAFFITYCVTLLHAMIHKKWSILTAFLISLTSIIPFAPFFLDKWLAKEDKN